MLTCLMMRYKLNYLKEFHQNDITDLLNNGNDCFHVSVNVNLTHLHRTSRELYAQIVQDVWNVSPKWDQSLIEAQKQLIEGNCFLESGFQIKENCHVRFVNLPQLDAALKSTFPGNDQVGQFVQVKGNVVRMSQGRLLEYKRQYRCSRCKEIFTLEAQYTQMYIFEPPRKCLKATETCKGNLYPVDAQPKPECCMDYQEIRLQELFSDKYLPASLTVSLDNDLVDYCQPGDCVTVCGTIEIRWPQLTKGKRFEVRIVLRAISICRDEEKMNFGKDLSEQLVWVRAQWQDTVDSIGNLNARDMIVRSICPEVHGMYLVKLAIALALCSGVQCTLAAGANKRGSSHVLLVGDPGLAKSRLLKAASKIALRSVHTTGMGCSAAGLTAAAIKEGGEWQLEAGALVLADGGVCCIDEFNLMSQSDKASIHEAMEQQTISMAKAGLVCKLSTRCVVLAATNPRNLYSMSEAEGTSYLNIGIGSPLLSRFDIVLILRDERDPEWDNRISDHILKHVNSNKISDDQWELERLQSHFLAVQEIMPELTDEANLILGSYYKYCRSDPRRDTSRTTARLLDSLNRLAQAHARLMFRTKVEAIDAVMVIRLVEASWGFGRLWSVDILRENLPLGPNEQQIREFIKLLGLERLEGNIMDNLKSLDASYEESRQNKSVKNNQTKIIGNLENIFGFNRDGVKRVQKSSETVELENVKSNFKNVSNSIVKTSKKLSPKPTTFSSEQATKKLDFKVKRLFPQSNLFDDLPDLDCIDNLDLPKNKRKPMKNKTTELDASKATDTTSTGNSPTTTQSQSKASALNRILRPLDVIDDIDLELDISSLRSSNARNGSRKIENQQKSSASGSDPNKLEGKRTMPAISASETTGSGPNENKKPRLSMDTLAKLNRFMYPKVVNADNDELKEIPKLGQSSGKGQNEFSKDSAYQPVTKDKPQPKSTLNNSNVHLALINEEEDDLKCLDFDI